MHEKDIWSSINVHTHTHTVKEAVHKRPTGLARASWVTKETLKLVQISFPQRSSRLFSAAMHFLTKFTSLTTISPEVIDRQKINHWVDTVNRQGSWNGITVKTSRHHRMKSLWQCLLLNVKNLNEFKPKTKLYSTTTLLDQTYFTSHFKNLSQFKTEAMKVYVHQQTWPN